MSTKYDSYGMSQTYVNGKKISDLSYDATYNGKYADIATRDGKIKTFMRLSNNDIEKLLNNNNSSQESLHDKIRKHSRTQSRSRSTTKNKTRKRSPTRSKTMRRRKRKMKKGKRSRKQKVKKSIPAIDREVIW